MQFVSRFKYCTNVHRYLLQEELKLESRAIELFLKLAHRCWTPLPTNRIVCDTGSDDLLRRICHPVCSVSVTPSKTRLIGFLVQRETSIHCHREKQQGSTSLHFVGSHNGNGFRVAHLQDGQDAGLCGLSGNIFETAC